MQKPMISVAGIRGTIGGSLVPEEFLKFTAAFTSTLENRTIVVGGDTRPSRAMVQHLVMGACLATGCHVFDLGVCPTPTVGLMTKQKKAGGGIAITASHNPLNWNALKFFTSDGTFLTAPEMEKVLARYDQIDFDYQPYEKLGYLETVGVPCKIHLEKTLAAIDADQVRQKNFSVAIDLCNGAGIALLPELLKQLNCQTAPILNDPEKAFERVAEPLPQNLGALSEKVKETGAAIGFAVDPDADRLALVDETGRPIGEERTLTLISRYILQKDKAAATKPLVANLSTTRALDDVAAEFGTTVERTRIGEANVVDRIRETGAVIGGEGNGGVIYPAIHPGRDAAAGIALVLEMLAVTGKTLSQINSETPDYVMVKDKVDIEGKDLEKILSALKTCFADAVEFNETDGLKISLEKAWLHVRPSGTEPILRVFTEAPDEKEARTLAEQAMEIAQSG